MKDKMITYFKKIDFSWIMLILSLVCLLSVCIPKIKGEDVYFLNHRSLFIESGSMEPNIKKYSLVITKKITNPSKIEEGDVVSFYVTTNNGNRELILHRIIDIEDGRVFTKGDNNDVADNFYLTTEDIVDEEVITFNWVSWIVHTLLSGPKGVLIVCCSGLSVTFFFIGIKFCISSYFEKEK